MPLTVPTQEGLRRRESLTPAVSTPPLRNGDVLGREEFERRYHGEPHCKKAELIQGRVYVPSPLSIQGHARPHAELGTWLGNYYMATPGTLIAGNGTVRLDDRNEPQPDLVLTTDPDCGGRARLGPDDYFEGGPEWIAEIAGSSAGVDLHEKHETYAAHGVGEYVVWRTEDRELDWFVLHEGQYVLQEPDPDGVYRSRQFPGLWLDPQALLNRDFERLLQVLGQGLASPEHTAFLEELARRRGAP
ncbi:MAG: Uma2 family endonuclease [Armatimonadetes bacterium]|nr:Uma2 family endonuclease [Armatimonadota bacterium]